MLPLSSVCASAADDWTGVIGLTCGVGVGVTAAAGSSFGLEVCVLPTALVNTSTTATSARHSKIAPDQKV